MTTPTVPEAMGGPPSLEVQDVPVARRRLRRGSILGELIRRPAAIFAMLVIAALLLMLVAAPLLAPHDPLAPNFDNRYGGPSGEHLLGTDAIGRDLLSRVIYGGQRALLVAIPATLIGLIGGLALGMISGYFGGKIDNTLIIVTDTLLAMPPIIMGIAFLLILGRNIVATLLLFGLAFLPGFYRYMRAQVMAVKNHPYVLAERALGASTRRILFLHALPNALPPLVIMMAFTIAAGMAAEAGLAFVGLGAQPPTPSWGVMFGEGLGLVQTTVWPLVAPLIALGLATTAFTLFGETMQDVMDPKRRQRTG